MYTRCYSVAISNKEHKTFPEQDGYVLLPHNTQYLLRLRNNGVNRCEAHVEVDGKHIGTWIIDSKQTISLERPTNSNKRFTFYQLDSREGKTARLDGINEDDLGLISVTFTPELKPAVRKKFPIRPIGSPFDRKIGSRGGGGQSLTFNDFQIKSYNCCDSQSITGTPGGTGLSGKSNQEFIEVLGLSLNKMAAVTINLRLVCDDSEAVEELKPASPVSTPIPPPIRRK